MPLNTLECGTVASTREEREDELGRLNEEHRGKSIADFGMRFAEFEISPLFELC
jgi:hypothetical protein